MYFINNSKESPKLWHRYETKEAVAEHMNRHGGTYTIQQGEKFDPEWVDDEEEFRRVFKIYDAGPESGTFPTSN